MARFLFALYFIPTFNLPYCPYEWKLTHVGFNADRNRWYRRWSDSFIQQGGQGTNSYAQFPWTMADANYAASIINVDSDTGTQGVGLVSRSSTGFYLQRYTGGTYNVVWLASGKGAESQSPWAAMNIIKYI
ncbi:MAG: hypothetical protein J5598_01735 [Clostridia bacterium]|nr:hypothetical protein [Clostridia bacterium]